MTATIAGPQVWEPEVREDIRHFAKAWWLFLITGIGWIFVSFFVLQFNLDSVVTIGILFAVVLMLAGINELVAMAAMPGWRLLHGLLGFLFLFGGIWALTYPGQTFGTLALLIGWFLLVKGTFDIVAALSNRSVEMWWLTLVNGIIQIAIAFWAIGYPGRSAKLLVLWVGISALMRGFSEIALAFQVRAVLKEVSA